MFFRLCFNVFIFLIFCFRFAYSVTDVPKWVNDVPKSQKFYYFVGTHSSKNKSRAIINARKDALGQVLLLVGFNLSVRQLFSSSYNEDNSSFFSDTKQFSNIGVSGFSFIRNFKVLENVCDLDAKLGFYTCYILSRISKKTIQRAKGDVDRLNSSVKGKKVFVIALNKNDNGFSFNKRLENYFENFYQENGYRVVQGIKVNLEDLDFDDDNIGVFLDLLLGKADILVYSLLSVEKSFKKKIFDKDYFVLHAQFLLKKIQVINSNLIFVKNFKEKGLSYDSYEKSFLSLETNIFDKLNFADKILEKGYLSY